MAIKPQTTGLSQAMMGWVTFAVLLLVAASTGCKPSSESSDPASRRAGRASSSGATGSLTDAALASYVPPGELDEMYLFYSGGHSGNIFVAGIPSMRHISTIPVFTPYPGTGYGFDDETKEMLGDYTWGDCHHPALSKTNGDYDGRWLFINDNANNRYARIDLRDFKTKQIFGPVPNVMGMHGGTFLTENSEYCIFGSRFSVPVPNTPISIESYATEYRGIVGALKIETNGTIGHGFQIITPPFNWDLGSCGRGPSADWFFMSCYNSERATGILEKTSTASARDYVIAVNWRKAEAAANGPNALTINGVKVIDPAVDTGICYLIPIPKSPHGVDVSPDGTYFVGSGKLEAVTTVYSFDKMLQAIEAQDYSGDEDGIPVLSYDSILEREVQIGLGPLHTQFDDKGMAYTSLFVDSAIAKWNPATGEVLDTIPVAYNIGHLCVPGGDAKNPFGKYVIALNKLSHGRHLSVGPSQPESSQLIDISGEKMKMIYEAFTEPEPHYAQAIPADLLNPIEVYPREHNTHPHAVWEIEEASVTRNGTKVDVNMVAVRSTLYPTLVEVNKGDTVTFHVTNIEQTTDELHGFAILMHNINIVIDPGETKSVTFVADKTGVFPYYCTNFCSALHQEMQAYMIVK